MARSILSVSHLIGMKRPSQKSVVGQFTDKRKGRLIAGPSVRICGASWT
jgi:hypothetical protein